MGFFNDFPYTNFHEMNLDWILRKMVELTTYVENYTAVNNVSYAGIWDITKQYPKWSIVSNGNMTYMSQDIVPAGIDIENEKYWLLLADLDPLIGRIIAKLAEINIVTAQTLVGELSGEAPEIGTAVLTLGYYSAGDGGGALYTVVDTKTDFVFNRGGKYLKLYNTDSVNIKSCGCRDGFDDTDRFIIAANLAKNEIIIPNGVFKVGNVSIHDKVVKGDGELSLGGIFEVEDCRIENLRISVNATTATLRCLNDTYVDGCRITGNNSDPVTIVGSGCHFSDNTISTTADKSCVKIIKENNNKININNMFTNCYFAGLGNGITIVSEMGGARPEGVTVDGCSFVCSQSSIEVFDVYRLTISDSILDQATACLHVQSSSKDVCEDISIDSCYMSAVQCVQTNRRVRDLRLTNNTLLSPTYTTNIVDVLSLFVQGNTFLGGNIALTATGTIFSIVGNFFKDYTGLCLNITISQNGALNSVGNIFSHPNNISGDTNKVSEVGNITL